ncbi:hypothetical protein SPAR70_0123 [Streptococcus pneumoniae GA41410]|nr:hypothetical protein SPAR70_0123 [Streptococcus pneumoniae GA41410]
MVLYPFTYDGSWRFQPINLLYFPEMVRDVIPINLVQEYCQGQPYGLLKKMLKRIRLSREIALLLATVIVYFFTHRILPLSVFTFMFSYILLFAQSYLGSNTAWIGNRRLIIDDEFEKILLSKSYIKEISSARYSEYLTCEYKNFTPIILLAIFENLLDSYLLQNQSEVDLDIFYKVLPLLYKEKYTMGFNYFVSLNYLLYKVGFLGIIYDNEALRDLSKQYLNKNISELQDGSFEDGIQDAVASKQIVVINEFIACLNSRCVPSQYDRFFIKIDLIFFPERVLLRGENLLHLD